MLPPPHNSVPTHNHLMSSISSRSQSITGLASTKGLNTTIPAFMSLPSRSSSPISPSPPLNPLISIPAELQPFRLDAQETPTKDFTKLVNQSPNITPAGIAVTLTPFNHRQSVRESINKGAFVMSDMNETLINDPESEIGALVTLCNNPPVLNLCQNGAQASKKIQYQSFLVELDRLHNVLRANK